MRQTRFAKMNLIINNAWHQNMARCVNHFVRLNGNGRVDLGDFVVDDQNICFRFARGQDDFGVFYQSLHGMEALGSVVLLH